MNSRGEYSARSRDAKRYSRSTRFFFFLVFYFFFHFFFSFSEERRRRTGAKIITNYKNTRSERSNAFWKEEERLETNEERRDPRETDLPLHRNSIQQYLSSASSWSNLVSKQMWPKVHIVSKYPVLRTKIQVKVNVSLRTTV